MILLAMANVHFNLEPILRRHKTTASALVEATGLAKATVYNIVNNKAKAVELETLGKLVSGLRNLTGEAVAIGDILKEETLPDWREVILRNAKPLDWEKVVGQLPAQTPEELAEGEAFIATLEEQRKQDKAMSNRQDRDLLDLFPTDEP